uniref:Zinc finger C3HC4 RING-type domain-containing protein n=1 Tax=Peromyscus maniculatus bairdii TaxID=230844 RepID=A0A8C8UK44_PERMB
MKKKSVYNQNVGDQECEDMEGEENRNNAGTSGLLYSEADRCPICLSCLLGKEVGFPESCNHVFCMTCILKWAEVSLRVSVGKRLLHFISYTVLVRFKSATAFHKLFCIKIISPLL